MTKPSLALALLLLASQLSVAALAMEPNPELLSIKGYSPQMVTTTGIQQDRMEWKQPPPPPRTPWQQFWHNVYTNDWTGSLDPIGYGTIRETL
jgi:hypothetical protein